MSFKTILVHADTEDDLARVMPAALSTARREGAHIVGLHVIRNPVPTVYSPYQVAMLTDVIDRMMDVGRQRAEDLRVAFERMIGAEVGIDGEWRTATSLTSEIDDALIDNARCCDLLVMAQPDPQSRAARMIGSVGKVMLQAGRPVLAIPYTGQQNTLGDHVLVAWNGSQESVRAVHDALPILRKAKEVRLYAVEAQGEQDSGALPGAELAATLARHGVRAIIEATTPGGSVAETVLSRAADHGSDLLVMGGYGHSRAREYVFGGVTRQILKTMTLPVLFSH